MFIFKFYIEEVELHWKKTIFYVEKVYTSSHDICFIRILDPYSDLQRFLHQQFYYQKTKAY